jgi:RimJ/RimL family protein N-acetyltransferase
MPKKEISWTIRPVDPNDHGDQGYLYSVLRMRLDEPNTNISHKSLPAWNDHVRFLRSEPYEGHYIAHANGGRFCSGVCYVDHYHNIGVYVNPGFRREGLGSFMIAELERRHPLPLWANVNPENEASLELFRKAGFKFLEQDKGQIVLKKEPPPDPT